jgi:DNA-binding MarR family transcriptional regulator
MEYYQPSDPDYSLWFSFRRVHEAIHKVRKLELRPYKLSTIETAVLLVVHESKNKTTPAEISRQLMKDPHSISQLLGRMEKRGLLRNTKGFRRKNMIRVSLTKKGNEAFVNSTKGKNIGKIMAVLSEEEKKQLGVYLEKLQEKAKEEYNW